VQSHSNLASTIAGTPYYWSPEVLKGVPYGLAADIWSVGVVAFELLTLKRCAYPYPYPYSYPYP